MGQGRTHGREEGGGKGRKGGGAKEVQSGCDAYQSSRVWVGAQERGREGEGVCGVMRTRAAASGDRGSKTHGKIEAALRIGCTVSHARILHHRHLEGRRHKAIGTAVWVPEVE